MAVFRESSPHLHMDRGLLKEMGDKMHALGHCTRCPRETPSQPQGKPGARVELFGDGLRWVMIEYGAWAPVIEYVAPTPAGTNRVPVKKTMSLRDIAKRSRCEQRKLPSFC